jgi:hypothetical protein
MLEGIESKPSQSVCRSPPEPRQGVSQEYLDTFHEAIVDSGLPEPTGCSHGGLADKDVLVLQQPGKAIHHAGDSCCIARSCAPRLFQCPCSPQTAPGIGVCKPFAQAIQDFPAVPCHQPDYGCSVPGNLLLRISQQGNPSIE